MRAGEVVMTGEDRAPFGPAFTQSRLSSVATKWGSASLGPLVIDLRVDV